MAITDENARTGGRTARVFFAIWPDNKARERLDGLVRRLRTESLCGGRETKAENIHLTLVFVGEVVPNKLEALHAVADVIACSGARAFHFAIGEVRYWKHNQIVYGAPREVPEALGELVNALQAGLSAEGFALEQRAYAPHITLMRHAHCQALPELTEPIGWRAREWVLVKSEQTSGGSVYTVIGRWPLA